MSFGKSPWRARARNTNWRPHYHPQADGAVMAYFSNGSEGEAFEEQWCDRCTHQGNGCTIWLLHQVYNYEECNNKKSMLHVLIPRSKDGLSNEQCTMFHKQPGERS